MSYELKVLRRAQRELENLPSDSFIRVCERIRNLAQTPRPHGCSKLTGRDGWRIRIGNYRVVYEIDDEKRVVTVLHIGHRRDVYR